jgi:predicted  nucleic acid-binding Zn-ribbon protein
VAKDSPELARKVWRVIPVRQLYDLQRLDSELARRERELAGLDDGTTLRALVEQAAAEASAAAAELRAQQARLQLLELELQSIGDKAQKLERDLYSGRIGNPKELTAMQEDLAALSRQRRRIEDEMLALMEDIERLTARAAVLDAQQAARARELAAHLQQYEERRRALGQEIEALRQAREAQAATIDAELLRRYERLRPRKDGVAVTAVVRGVCEGCHVAIPEGRVAEILEGDRIFTCEECGRILYVPET